jgi:hypothetical protein
MVALSPLGCGAGGGSGAAQWLQANATGNNRIIRRRIATSPRCTQSRPLYLRDIEGFDGAEVNAW